MLGPGTAVRTALAVVAGYLGTLTVAATSRRRPSTVIGPGGHRYCILVPAHDEERLIAGTVESLIGLDYTAGRVGVHVVADNCTDRTAELARSAGAEVHERVDPQRPGKGPALQWLLGRLAERGDLGDVVVFVDADTVVDPGFLRAIDAQLAAGADVIQGYYAVRDADGSPAVAFRAAAMAARAYLRPLGRTALGGTAGLHGNGMAFRTEVMAQRRWSDHLTEDVELSLDLLLEGTRVAFAPDARVAAEMPASLSAAQAQHERWERGRIELVARYVPTLVRRSACGGPAGRVAYLDAALDLLVPPLSVVAAAASAWGAAGAARALLPGRRGGRDVVLAGATIAVLTAHAVTALRLTDAPPATYRALLQTPRMVVWKVGVWFRVLTDPRRARWTRTERNA